MSEGLLNYAEYGVAKKAEGDNLTKRILLVLLYVFFGSGYIVFFLTAVKMPQVIAVLPLLIWMLIFFTWHLVKYDYEYKIEQGEMVFYIAYSPKKKKEQLRFKIRDAEKIAPVACFDDEQIKNAVVYDYRGTAKSPDSYIAYYLNEGKGYAVYFEATTRAVKLMCKFNEKTVLSEELRH